MTLQAATRALLPEDLAGVPREVVESIRGARTVLAVCHENPESDALGSALGIALAVEQLGGRATPVCSDPVPEMYEFMPQIARFRREPDPALAYDLIVVSDCGDLTRVGAVLSEQAELFGRLPVVNIDHHLSNPRFGTVDWVDAGAAATCEMVTLLMPALGIPLDAAEGAIAAALIAGIVIDTANFMHPSTTARTLRAAAELVAAGAPLAETARLIYRSKPAQQLKLFGFVLARLRQEGGGRVVWSTMTEADLRTAGARSEHSEGIVDLLSQAIGAEVVVLLKEAGETTRLSIRTVEGGVDATQLAGLFGGGGHARAAGATVALPLEKAIEPVIGEAVRLADAVRR
ncbi:MAG TPA: DHH family phosphoesterase [Candidatus Limnocylindrales bacterium]|jgi:phosphoesterase RecJ-like protein|nr:DHH family phosphoesterase [Candidatus Limnocylindrales bacterium]